MMKYSLGALQRYPRLPIQSGHNCPGGCPAGKYDCVQDYGGPGGSPRTHCIPKWYDDRNPMMSTSGGKYLVPSQAVAMQAPMTTSALRGLSEGFGSLDSLINIAVLGLAAFGAYKLIVK